MNKTTVLLSALLITTVAYSGEIYKWTDKDGRVHFGDSSFQTKTQSPEKVKLVGTKVTEAQRREAEANAARNRLQAEGKGTAAPVTDPAASSAVAADSMQTSQNGSPINKRRKECQEQWQRYMESQECFGPYSIQGGGLRGEAFQHCSDIKQPDEFCD